MLCHPAPVAERGKGPAWPWIGGAAAFLVALIACWWLIDLKVAADGLEPAGTACTWETDAGSGPSGRGSERLQWRWGVWPEGTCIGADGSVHAREQVEPVSSLRPTILEHEPVLPWVVAYAGSLVIATAAGVAVVVVLRRRR
jgi:hypothetical protein